MKSNVLLDKIIREELIKLRTNQLNEFYIRSQVNPEFEKQLKDPANRNKMGYAPWKNKQAELVLKSLGARPFSNGLNPYGYELDVDLGIANPSAVSVKTPVSNITQDRLLFYEDGSVRSTNQGRDLKYNVKNNVIVFWLNGKQQGTVSKSGGKAVFYSSIKTSNQLMKGDTTNNILDAIQTGVDWTTLVLSPFFPGLSDAVDLINAFGYFVRKKYFEGFLSSIAVIPYVGSALSRGIRIAVGKSGNTLEKLLKQAYDSNNYEATLAFWAKLKETNAVNADNLSMIGTGLNELTKVIAYSKKPLTKIPGGTELINQLKRFETWITQSKKAISEISEASAKSKLTGRLNKPGIQTITFGSKLSGRILTKVVKAVRILRTWRSFPTRRLEQLASAMKLRFVKQMTAPESLMAIISTMKRSDIIKIIAPTNSMIQKTLQNKNLDEIYNWLKQTSTSAPKEYSTIQQNVTDYAIKNGNLVWNLFKDHNIQNLAALWSKSDYYRGFYLDLRKAIPVFYNEFQDVLEDANIGKDELNGIIYPAIKYMLSDILGWWNIQNTLNAIGTNKWTKTILNKFGYVQDAEGRMRAGETIPYNPKEPSKPGKYK